MGKAYTCAEEINPGNTDIITGSTPTSAGLGVHFDTSTITDKGTRFFLSLPTMHSKTARAVKGEKG